MPIDFAPQECFELLRYGKFTLLHISGEIPASESTDITERPMPRGSESVRAHYPLMEDWGMLTERFNWGGTSRPDKVYYELWSKGMPEELEVASPVYGELTDFYCGAKIRDSNVENRSTHIVASESVDVKLWNCSDPAEDVDWDFTVWYYMYHLDYFDEVLEILRKRDRLLENIRELLQIKCLEEAQEIEMEELSPKTREALEEIELEEAG